MDVSIFVDYVYLDSNERELFLRGSYRITNLELEAELKNYYYRKVQRINLKKLEILFPYIAVDILGQITPYFDEKID